jgi:co-chaperonin GroES (HSP10)
MDRSVKKISKVQAGICLVQLEKDPDHRRGVSVVTQKDARNIQYGTIKKVGGEDQYGLPIWEVGDKVILHGRTGSNVIIDEKPHRLVHHLQIKASYE